MRKGILPSMLEEILNTRIMVKQSMKTYKQDKALMRLLDARQLGLKLIANVTFGYTAANYSGRMPSVEVSSSTAGKLLWELGELQLWNKQLYILSLASNELEQ